METPSDSELYEVLGLKPDADAEALRAAYLAKIREHPPERDPETFERIRDAYQALSDPVRKMRSVFDPASIRMSLQDMVATGGGNPAGRPFLGTKPWLEALERLERAAEDERRKRR